MSQFVRQEVLTGLEKLYTLRLVGTPPADGLKATALVWIEAIQNCSIAWNEQDQGRITKAFNLLILDVERWPSPKMLIERLPPRQRERVKELPKPPLSPEEKARNLQKLREMTNKLFKQKEL